MNFEENQADFPPWHISLMRLIDSLESFDARGDVPEELIGGLGHLVHKLKAKDTTGRWAYYFVLVFPRNEARFLESIAGDGTIDLEDYGKVVASCYGEEPTKEVLDFLKEKYGFVIDS